MVRARTLVCGVLLPALSACSLLTIRTPERPLSTPELNARILTREVSAQFAAAVDSCASDIAATEHNEAVLDNALRWEIAAVGESRRAALRVAPLMSVLDSWALAEQMKAFVAEGAPGGALFGAHQERVRQITAAYADDTEALAHRVATPQQFHAYQSFVAAYVREHPLADLGFARASVVALWSREQGADTPVVDSLGTISEAMSDTAERLEIFGDTVPTQMMRRTELALAESGYSRRELKAALARLDERLERLQAVAESTPALVHGAEMEVRSSLREVLDRLAASARDGESALHTERTALFQDIRAERVALMAAVDEERKALAQDAGRISGQVVRDAGLQLRDLAGEVLLLGIVFIAILLGLPFAAGYLLGRARHGGGATR